MSAETADAARALLLYGTTEPVTPMRPLKAGLLTASFDRGNVRYVQWGGFEVLRAVAFIVRDTAWGTYDPDISDLVFDESADTFGIRYKASVSGSEGDFSYEAEIRGSADGTLTFHATGTSKGGFDTNRTGFVVLHPLVGVVGRTVSVTHASGGEETAMFPDLIDPQQPVLDIRALRHEAMPGLTVTVSLHGDTFEMEDHRNWTDASFKTYVRPLSRGFPYRIGAGELLDQSVALRVEGTAPPAAVKIAAEASVRLGKPDGSMPAIGLFVPEPEKAMAEAVSRELSWLGLSYLVLRVDARRERTELAAIGELARRAHAPIALEIIVSGTSAEREVVAVAGMLDRHGIAGDTVLIVPARDLGSRPANTIPDGEATSEAILAAARKAFPDVRVGGGMPVGFPEFNRNRPPAGVDFVTHATQTTVHAADDISVMETLQSLPDLVRSVRAIAGKVPYRLGPATIGAPTQTYAGRPAMNPANRRLAQAENDPRQRGLFAAAFAVGYAAAAAACHVEALTLGALTGWAGVFSEAGQAFPIASLVRGLAAGAGKPRIAAEIKGASSLAALAYAGPDGKPVLWLANLSDVPIVVTVEGAAFEMIWRMDADRLAAASSAAITEVPLGTGPVRLDAYAVACLR